MFGPFRLSARGLKYQTLLTLQEKSFICHTTQSYGIVNMMTLEQIREKLQDRKLSVVSAKTGVSYHLVRRAADGADVSHKAAAKLSEYLAA